MRLSLRQAIDEAPGKLQSGMAVLASVSSSAPFVGLFGTVWGIYHALVAIGVSGQPSIDKVAGPAGVRSNKTLLAKLNTFGFDLQALCITGARAEQINT